MPPTLHAGRITSFTGRLRFLVFLFLIAVSCSLTTLAQSGGVPFVNQPLVPGSAVPGGPGFTLTVNGCNFVSGATVRWNGIALTTMFISNIQLAAAVPASDIATAGTAVVTVSNPGGTTSAPVLFEVTSPTTTLAFAENNVGTIPGYITSFLVGDFNGDGKPDVAVSVSEGQVTIFLNNGNGTFRALPSFTLPSLTDPSLLLAADINNDGKLDLLAYGQNQSLTLLMPLLGNGDGTFNPVATQAYSGTNEHSVAVTADFNHDGKLDLAYGAISDGGLVVQLGNGDGTFQNPMQTTLLFPSGGIAAGDFNRDDNLDLDIAGISVLLGAGDGTFGTPNTISNIWGATSVADLNNDGFLDILGKDGEDVFLGNGDGTFGLGIATSLQALALADMNGDGILDLANGLAFALGNGDGSFQSPINIPDFGTCCLGVLYADFNGDGRMDMVTNACPNGYCPPSTNPSAVSILFQTTAQVSPFSTYFGDENLGTSAVSQNIQFTNVGTSSLTINSVTLGGPNPGDFIVTSNTCGSSLAPDTTCAVGVAFAPRGIEYRYAALLFNDGAAASPQQAFLAGFGVGTSPAVQITPTSLTFPSQPVGTPSAYQTVTITNTGNAGVSFNGIGFVGADPGDFSVTDGCSPGVGVGNSCKLYVTFTPMAAGARNATLQITDNVPGSPQNVPVSGTGGSSPGLEVPSGSSSSATVAAGATANYTLQIGGGGMSGTATLTCSGAPTGATCSLPGSETVSATSASEFTVSVSTTARTSSALTGRSLEMWAMLLFGLVVLPTSRCKKHRALLQRASLSLFLILFISSCGGGGSGSGGGTGVTPAGTYNLTVTATLNGTMQSQVLKLTVQ